MAYERSVGRRGGVSPGRWSVGTLCRLLAPAMVSRIWNCDSVHEIRGRTVIPGARGAPAPQTIGGMSMRLAIVFLIALVALAAFEAVPQAEAQADPCVSLEIASVGGSASNGYVLWVWKGSPLAGCGKRGSL